MHKNKLRRIIQEEVKLGLAKNAFGEEFEYLLTEVSLNEFNISDMFSGITGFISDNFGQASIDSLKQFFITEIFKFLNESGLPITPDSVFGSILINVIQNLTASDVKDYFSEGGCEKVADRIIMGVQEGLQEEVVFNKIVEVFFGEGARLEGLVGSPIRELINIKLKDMTSSIRDPLVDFACSHRDINKLKDAMTKSVGSLSSSGSDDKNQPIIRFKK